MNALESSSIGSRRMTCGEGARTRPGEPIAGPRLMIRGSTAAAQSLEVRIVPRLHVRQRHAGDGAEDLALPVRRSRGRREGNVLAKHVGVALAFAEQLATALLQHDRGD